MIVERWNPEVHLEVLGAWLRGHGLADDAGLADYYPPTGFMVDGCAVGFVYATNAPRVGYLDGIVCAPDAPPRRVRDALERLAGELVGEASRLGIAVLWAMTPHRGLLRICRRHGFADYGAGFTCLVRSPACPPQPQAQQ